LCFVTVQNRIFFTYLYVASCWLYLKEYINDARTHERQKLPIMLPHCRSRLSSMRVLRVVAECGLLWHKVHTIFHSSR